MKIAIYGPMCSGKTTISNIIKDINSDYQIFSFGQKIKDLAVELFSMEGKNRSLLIGIASKLREIDEDVWVKYVMDQVTDLENCIIDDLRFQNELNALTGWTIICLNTPKEIRIQRIKELYPDNWQDHIQNMDHISETDTLNFPENTVYIDGSKPLEEITQLINKIRI
tara:strand:- start:2561 stop:3064 length:504 start_codon:yes stop_codon:yes gene_type:complete